MSLAATVADEDVSLPALREDLKLLQGAIAFDGSPTWNIFDPVRKKYFRIGWLAFQLLSRWSAGKAQVLLAKVRAETTSELTMNDLQDLVKFLYGNSLTRDSVSGTSRDYLAQYNATRLHWFLWVLHNYLFMRIPLVRPNKFIRRTLPYVELLFTKTFRITIFGMGLVGLYLTARQWDVFISTFLYFFNLKGLMFYFGALFVLKVFHELGHAYVAARYGCHITTMGVALLVMFPVLYTDTTDSWRLISRQQRILVGAGGMIAEIYIALAALFLWNFLPDGTLKSIAFVIATTSWIMSVAINTNIFMRFDGYYIFSDFLGIENLQERSFALGRWRLREILFNLGFPPPETLPKNTSLQLVLYAWAVWIYRISLYLGIALLVYHFFIKLVGIFLFAVEMVWFILNPVYRELKVWWGLRERIMKSRRFPYFVIIILILFGLLIFPFRTTVSIPAILETRDELAVYSLAPGKLTAVNIKEGDLVNKGDVLFVIESPQLDQEILQKKIEIDVVNYRINRRAANPEDLAETLLLVGNLQELESSLKGLMELRDTLTIRASISGKVVDVTRNLHPGRWINEDLQLGTIISPQSAKLSGIIQANDYSLIELNQNAVFLPKEAEIDEVNVTVSEIEDTNVDNISDFYFTSLYGGDVAVRKGRDGKLIPEEASYRITFHVNADNYPVNKVIVGHVFISAKQQSLIVYIYDSVISALIRESGF